MIRHAWLPVGLAMYRLDRLVEHLGLRRVSTPQPRKTGQVVEVPERPQVTELAGGVALLRYPGSPSHSLWRSQEFSLFRQYGERLSEPRLDFGCGDGSLSSALFGRVALGIDPDAEAVAVAQRFGVYERAICAHGAGLPLDDGTVGSVFAISVFEHTDGVEPVLAELHRVIRPGGRLAFSVPTEGFTRHLVKYFGPAEAEFINRLCDHHQMYPVTWWRERVERAGFRIEVERQFQPDWFTFFYRTLTTGTGAFLLRHGLEGSAPLRWLQAALVRRSLKCCAEGANVFMLAVRP